jgi:hypothetical protein
LARYLPNERMIMNTLARYIFKQSKDGDQSNLHPKMGKKPKGE